MALTPASSKALITAPKTVFEDTHVLVISKPAGLLSQGEISGEPNLVDWCRAHFGRNYVGLVHRLDRNTSGLMVIAKRSKSAERLTASLQSGELVRTYEALLSGNLLAPAEWVHSLKKNESTNLSAVVKTTTPGAKEARLKVIPLAHYKTADGGEAFTHAEFKLDTGRSHQIRVQSSAMHHPLVGDAKYGGPTNLLQRPALHSAFLSFPHPMTKETLRFRDELASDLIHFLNGLRRI